MQLPPPAAVDPERAGGAGPGRKDAGAGDRFDEVDGSRWEETILAGLDEMPGPARAAVVASHACGKLWPDLDPDALTAAAGSAEPEVAEVLERLARASRIRRWEPGERYPSDQWNRGGWSWETCDEALYATLEHARLWAANAEWDDRERLRAVELARRLTALTGWDDVAVSPSEPAVLSLRLSVTEAEELAARLSR